MSTSPARIPSPRPRTRSTPFWKALKAYGAMTMCVVHTARLPCASLSHSATTRQTTAATATRRACEVGDRAVGMVRLRGASKTVYLRTHREGKASSPRLAGGLDGKEALQFGAVLG